MVSRLREDNRCIHQVSKIAVVHQNTEPLTVPTFRPPAIKMKKEKIAGGKGGAGRWEGGQVLQQQPCNAFGPKGLEKEGVLLTVVRNLAHLQS